MTDMMNENRTAGARGPGIDLFPARSSAFQPILTCQNFVVWPTLHAARTIPNGSKLDVVNNVLIDDQ